MRNFIEQYPFTFMIAVTVFVTATVLNVLF